MYPNPITSQSFHICPLPLQHAPPKLIKNKPNKPNPISLLSFQHFSILVTLGALVCHTLYPFVQSATLQKVSLVWHTIITGSSLKLLSDTLLLL